MLKQKPTRRITRKPFRKATRRSTRLRKGARRPDHLGLALSAFSRAIRAHRLLAKLAPRLFDFSVVDREAAARREELDRRRFLQPILNKVYGLPADAPLEQPCHAPDSRVPKNGRTRQAMEREYACWQLWMSTGHYHMDSFQRALPHARIALKRLARLLDLGSTSARLATGQGEK